MSAAAMLRRIFIVAFLAAGIVVSLYASAFAQTDPLSAWNDGAVKKSITDFVARATATGRRCFGQTRKQNEESRDDRVRTVLSGVAGGRANSVAR
jgi:hypothetical protein